MRTTLPASEPEGKGGGGETNSPSLPRTEGIPGDGTCIFKIKTVPGKQGQLSPGKGDTMPGPHCSQCGPSPPGSMESLGSCEKCRVSGATCIFWTRICIFIRSPGNLGEYKLLLNLCQDFGIYSE